MLRLCLIAPAEMDNEGSVPTCAQKDKWSCNGELNKCLHNCI